MTETNIEKFNLQDIVLEDYINGDTIGTITKKYSSDDTPLSWQNVAYFIQKEEEENTERWNRLLTRKSQSIFVKLEQMNKRLERMMNELEKIKDGDETEQELPLQERSNNRNTRIIALNREIRQTLELQQRQIKLITDIWEKINNQQRYEKIKDQMIMAIKEESPETALKIIQRLKSLREEQNLLLV